MARLNEVLAAHPQIAVVEFGGNDGLRGLPATATRANLDKIVSTLKGAGVKVALAGITLPPEYGEDYIKQFNDTYTLAAKKFGADAALSAESCLRRSWMIQDDKTHATAKGNAVSSPRMCTHWSGRC